MRVQLRIPPHVWDQLAQVALKEHRPPRHQAELLLWQAIAQAVQVCDEHDQAERPEHAAGELATTWA